MSKKIIKEGYDISQLPRIPKSSKWIPVSELGTILKNDVKKYMKTKRYEDNYRR